LTEVRDELTHIEDRNKSIKAKGQNRLIV